MEIISHLLLTGLGARDKKQRESPINIVPKKVRIRSSLNGQIRDQKELLGDILVYTEQNRK
jgi:hypothetical protein